MRSRRARTVVVGSAVGLIAAPIIGVPGTPASATTFGLVDDVPPTLVISHVPDGNSHFHIQSPVTVSIDASDADSGLSGPPTCTDNGNPLTVSGSTPSFSASVSGDGTHAIECTATDNNFNTAHDSVKVRIDTTLPTVSVGDQGEGSLSAFPVVFSEPVDLGPEGAMQVLTLDATTLPGDLSCTSGFTPFHLCRKWAFTPSEPAVPGAPYDFFFQAQPDAFVDKAGNQLAQTFSTVRGTTLAMFDDDTIHYRWSAKALTGALGGAVTREREPAADFTYTFRGKKLTWFTVKGPDQGIASVNITDPSSPVSQTVNNYAATTQTQAPVVFSGLSKGTHTVTITVTGVRGNPAAKNRFVSLDALQVGSNAPIDNPDVDYSWEQISTEYVATSQPAARATFSFYGTGFSWQASYAPDGGKARVIVDGTPVGIVDLYSDFGQYYFFAQSGLVEGRHTVEVVSLNSNNPLSTGKVVSVRWFRVTS